MFSRLEDVEKRYEDLSTKLTNPKVIANQREFQKYSREYAEVREIVDVYRSYKSVQKQIEEGNELASGEDSEMVELAREELKELEGQKEELTKQLKLLLIPKDPNDAKNVFWKYVLEPVETKPLYSQPNFFEFTFVLQNASAGRSKLCRKMKRA